MRYALIDDAKTDPFPKGKGFCPCCGSEMIAKCGRVKVWHWAHQSKVHCDAWWENETQWHRDWKDNFPKDWQECIHRDPITGEKHIADVKNPYGLVVEFQNSPISPEEMSAREAFYEGMVWVVNGKSSDLNESYFNMGLRGPIQKNPLAYQVEWWSKNRLLHNWSTASAKVYLDFGGDTLWRLVLFVPEKRVAVVGPMPKKFFIEYCLKGKQIGVTFLPDPTLEQENSTKLDNNP